MQRPPAADGSSHLPEPRGSAAWMVAPRMWCPSSPWTGAGGSPARSMTMFRRHVDACEAGGRQWGAAPRHAAAGRSSLDVEAISLRQANFHNKTMRRLAGKEDL